jgi:superfamily I DNA/RNA helicase
VALKFSSLSELGRGVVVIGGAGAGKTHALSSAIEGLAPLLNMQSHQVVPVLSAMHGARRRLLQRLGAVQRSCRERNVGLFLEVSTIDAFALSIVTRLHTRTTSDLPRFDVGDFSPVVERQ